MITKEQIELAKHIILTEQRYNALRDKAAELLMLALTPVDDGLETAARIYEWGPEEKAHVRCLIGAANKHIQPLDTPTQPN